MSAKDVFTTDIEKAAARLLHELRPHTQWVLGDDGATLDGEYLGVYLSVTSYDRLIFTNGINEILMYPADVMFIPGSADEWMEQEEWKESWWLCPIADDHGGGFGIVEVDITASSDLLATAPSAREAAAQAWYDATVPKCSTCTIALQPPDYDYCKPCEETG